MFSRCNARRLAAGLACLTLVASGGAVAKAPDSLTAETFEVGGSVYVRALASDPSRSSMWVGTSVGALEIDLESTEPKQVLTRKDGLANEYVFAIGVAPDGGVWFGTNGGGTSRWKDGDIRTYFPMHGLADYWVYAFDFDDEGRAWIGTWDGANLFDPEGETWTTYHDELVNIWVYGLDIDKKGRIWFGTEGGVSMFDGAKWRSWTHEDGLGAANSLNLPASDNTGLGTKSRHDLSIYVDGSESYNPNYVFAAQVDSTGRGIWFGTWGGGVSLFDGESTWSSFTKSDGLPGNVVYSIAQQPDGLLWFGTDNGVASYDGETFRTYPLPANARHIYSLAIGPDGSIWAGAHGSVLRLTAKEPTP